MINYGQSKLDRGEALSNFEMYSLCQAYFRMRDYERLKACNTVLLPRLEQSGYRHDLGSRLKPDAALVEPLCWQAFAALEIGEFENAMELSLEAQERGNRAAGRYIGGAIFRLRPKLPLMLAYAHQGETQKAMAILNELKSKQSSYFTWGEENAAYLGQAYLLLGQPESAIKILEDGHLFQDDKYRAALRRVMLAKAKKSVGRLDEARSLLEQLANDPIVRESRDILYVVLLELSELLAQQGGFVSAEQHLRRAVDATEGVRATLSTEAAKIGFSRGLQAAYGLLVEVLVEQGKAREGLEYAERGKARALVDTLASKSVFPRKRLSQDTSALLLEFENLQTQGKSSG
ncbi:MAG TPA: hypothetical protein EYQ54_18980, partial [Myxococcales bacterium]|nr:hypothetical protein [Myxococcales bacterium]